MITQTKEIKKEDDMMPLSMIAEGQPSVIKKIGGKEETRRFLENLGFVVGGTVTVYFTDRWKYDSECQRCKSCHR